MRVAERGVNKLELICDGPIRMVEQEPATGRLFAALALTPDELAEFDPVRIATIGPPWEGEWGNPHDTDGRVPEYEEDFGNDAPLAIAKMRGRSVNGVWTYKWHIEYNWPMIHGYGRPPTRRGLRLMRLHERDHCRGKRHGEGSPETNHCYSPTTNLWA